MFNTTAIGNLTRDPQLRTVNTNRGQQNVCNFDIAINTGSGENQTVQYVRVSTWGALADSCAKYLAKGRKIYAAGTVRPNSYQGSDGQTHLTLELSASTVEFLSPRSDGATSAPTGTAQSARPVARAAAPATNYDAPVVSPDASGFDVSVDELPF